MKDPPVPCSHPRTGVSKLELWPGHGGGILFLRPGFVG